MARDRKAALAASIKAEREASRGRVPRFDKFERAEAILKEPDDSLSTLKGEPEISRTIRAAHSHTIALERVIRDSFTMPTRDYKKITQLREKCLKAGMSVTKSEILRAGLHALENMSMEDLGRVVQSVEKVKTGRPGRE